MPSLLRYFRPKCAERQYRPDYHKLYLELLVFNAKNSTVSTSVSI